MKFLFLALIFTFFSCEKKNKVCLYQPQKTKKPLKKQNLDTISFIFMGDIMGHMPLLNASYNRKEKTYNFDSLFEKVSSIINNSDYAVANLELTLAGRPYTGYPTFSSPIKLAQACKKSGIDILATANNHSCDRGKKGIVQTIDALNNLNIKHLGTYKNEMHREESNLLVIKKNNFKIGLLNYTYGTNGLPIPKGTVVNIFDTVQIKRDIQKSKHKKLDKLIVIVHWGNEYQLVPSKRQRKLSSFFHNNGVDVIIGSHPHVIQSMEYYRSKIEGEEKLTVYSLGNFISNQRKPNTDGGAMVKIEFIKEKDKTILLPPNYYLTWVDKFREKGRFKYKIRPCAFFNEEQIKESSLQKMNLFIKNTRKRLSKDNKNVKEIRK